MPKGFQGFQKGHKRLRKNYYISEKTKGKISQTLKNNIPWNKGLKGIQISKFKGKTIPWLIEYQYKSGKYHFNWKDGKSRNIHGGKKYKKWRKKVFKKDNYTCIICGEKNGKGKEVYLIAHHKKSWSFFPKLRYLLENGETMCKNCHYAYHHLKEWKNNKWVRVDVLTY